MTVSSTKLEVLQGSTWNYGWLVTVDDVVIDETWSAAAQVRADLDSQLVLHTFTAAVTPEGVVVLDASAAESSAWNWRRGVYGVEVENEDGSLRLRVAQGVIEVEPEVVR